MMPLTMMSSGETNTIKKVGGKEETRRFLENLGFVVGGAVTVVSDIGGNLIVNVKIPELLSVRIWQKRLWYRVSENERKEKKR